VHFFTISWVLESFLDFINTISENTYLWTTWVFLFWNALWNHVLSSWATHMNYFLFKIYISYGNDDFALIPCFSKMSCQNYWKGFENRFEPQKTFIENCDILSFRQKFDTVIYCPFDKKLTLWYIVLLTGSWHCDIDWYVRSVALSTQRTLCPLY
jgi:hypothetical protein